MNRLELLQYVHAKGGVSAKFTKPSAAFRHALSTSVSEIFPEAVEWPIRRQIYHLIGDTGTEIPVCPNCTKFRSWNPSGFYNKTCGDPVCVGHLDSVKSARNRPEVRELAQERSKRTILQKYGVKSFFEAEAFKQLDICKTTNLKGNPDALRTYWNSKGETASRGNAIPDNRNKYRNSIVHKSTGGMLSSAKELRDFLYTMHIEQEKSLQEIHSEYLSTMHYSSMVKWVSRLGLKTVHRFTSDEQKQLTEFIKSVYDGPVLSNVRNLIHGELDIVMPDLKLSIEYCGLYWHSDAAGKPKDYHRKKLQMANDSGYRLITIFQDEWLYNTETVKQKLSNILGVSQSATVYARRSTLKLITVAEAKVFLNKHHIQGFGNGRYYIGAYHGTDIVAVMALKHIDKNNILLTRYATSARYVGGFTKMLKFSESILKDAGYLKVITFADRRWSDGAVYTASGFERVALLSEDYYYIVKGRRVHKFNFRHKQLSTMQGYDRTLSESENTKNMKIYRIWDCGKIKYEFIISNK